MRNVGTERKVHSERIARMKPTGARKVDRSLFPRNTHFRHHTINPVGLWSGASRAARARTDAELKSGRSRSPESRSTRTSPLRTPR